MTERAYTPLEVEDLRRVCRDKQIWGVYRGAPMAAVGYPITSGAYDATQVGVIAEEMVRTCIAAGFTAEDLLASDPPGRIDR